MSFIGDATKDVKPVQETPIKDGHGFLNTKKPSEAKHALPTPQSAASVFCFVFFAAATRVVSSFVFVLLLATVPMQS